MILLQTIFCFGLVFAAKPNILDKDSEKRDLGRTMTLVILTFISCMFFVAFLICIAQLSKFMKMHLNKMRSQYRQFKTLQIYRDDNFLKY